ncbi:vacuolar ATPase assembly integral membrane protein vma21 isoform X1 [Pygocentrus nattereri]|uniref:Vacuolar ATPase assembly factor VMA21 n=1 Tax=Pygocentrus nattereri TaxID=42514 RepID=A0AAR2L1E2_PYGNA|nr:vacuolar ATPase assembly integral membrane protein vma21 isoform X1 [Pygocentrus nattereri]
MQTAPPVRVSQADVLSWFTSFFGFPANNNMQNYDNTDFSPKAGTAGDGRGDQDPHGPSQSRNDGSLLSVLKTLLFFTILMITLPIGLYFTSKAYLFEASLGYSSNDSYFYAAIVAVIAVHVVLALFVYAAWNEGSRQSREGKQD